MNNSNLIYAYRKKTEDKIVYVGQTVNLENRHKQHVDYDPFNKNTKEYEYPLSRGIRKYGKDEYELIILEDNIDKDKLNDREQYWIQYYNTYWNGYNQTIGGSTPIKPVFTEDKIDIVIEMLRQEEYRYNDIIQKTGISMTHIYIILIWDIEENEII